MPRRANKDHVPVAPFALVPEQAKELFEITEMRSLTPNYFERFDTRADPGEAEEHRGSWTIALLLEAAGASSPIGAHPVGLRPVVMHVTDHGPTVYDEASGQVVLSQHWDRMCRIDLKPVEDGNYQVLALSFLDSPLALDERFPVASPTPLDRSEIGFRYLYTHANPSTFVAIDRNWSRAHIPQGMHQLPSLLG
jgi:hypothetical protein